MEKFAMSFSGGLSKKELLETIESQKKQLIQYQARFKDLVQAYKSLLKEKEALEASLKVLTVQCTGPTEPAKDYGSLHSEHSLDNAESGIESVVTSSSSQSDPADGDQVGNVEVTSAFLQSDKRELEHSIISSGSTTEEQTAASTNAELDRRVNQLKSQLSTLTTSLATVTQEKSRMEASFQADKRKMKQELEEAREKVEEECKQHQIELQALQEQLAESRARVIMQQHQHDQEQHDHGHVIRELQKLLQEERSLRQDVELKLEDARKTFAETMQNKDRELEYEERLKQVTEECETLRTSLQVLEAERSKPEQRVLELQQEIADLKVHFNQQLQQEIRKVAQAESCLQEQAQLEEQRVASLEERISELSGLLGACEKARQKDQQSAHRLREHILQLDTENKALAIAASTTRTTSSDLGIDEINLDVNTLKDKLEKVKKLLQLVAHKSPEQRLEIEKIMEGAGGGPEADKASVHYYQQELRQLKEEFERYKTRAQVVLKNKNGKDSAQIKELEEARDQLAELKEKYINLRVQSDEVMVMRNEEIKKHQQALTALHQAHKLDLEKLEAQHRENFLHLEEELHKQRERTMALLEEKDLELERLRAESIQGQIVSDVGVERGVKGDVDLETGRFVHEEFEMISHTLKLTSPQKNNLLLYAEQLARNEVEISVLRKQKHQLEEGLHQLQAKVFANEESHKEEIDELRAQLDKRIRDQSREGANLEYLKNIIYRFLTLQDSKGRQQTLMAILTILHFSPQEKQSVMKQQVQSWWTPRKR
ncbi:GRIP and coiled-coil domain-containing protein 1-like [Clarias magur]|uniref:GRIP and coiled-coil domain-containing protein 1 n=1 Tax=Clarias magur TaxID=1594786 RepID=A0A8J4UJ73_CLAMG|nr:GRIP and coiled-coil domain-containing protein 1-like [Clarias magur]